jgi:hypothetical protein
VGVDWLQPQVVGVLKMRTFLTGMPECKLGLNDKVLFESQGRSGKQKVGGGGDGGGGESGVGGIRLGVGMVEVGG